MMKTERHMRDFDRVLSRLFGKSGFPRTLVGDLAELLFLFERGENFLLKLRNYSGSRRQAAGLILQVEDFVSSDLAWTVRDLRPALRRIRKLAYSESKVARKRSGSAARADSERKRRSKR